MPRMNKNMSLHTFEDTTFATLADKNAGAKNLFCGRGA